MYGRSSLSLCAGSRRRGGNKECKRLLPSRTDFSKNIIVIVKASFPAYVSKWVSISDRCEYLRFFQQYRTAYTSPAESMSLVVTLVPRPHEVSLHSISRSLADRGLRPLAQIYNTDTTHHILYHGTRSRGRPSISWRDNIGGLDWNVNERSVVKCTRP